jgi:hypothetical protein
LDRGSVLEGCGCEECAGWEVDCGEVFCLLMGRMGGIGFDMKELGGVRRGGRMCVIDESHT